ncbi:4Fe-4S dicluster domain-containing protein [Zhenpiania hominis]|uniref:4Fe-4S dicluster domain-containing protein n=1 Tax=Zhenpiania hominis TaxID=2763644 RepID=UPI0039F51B68
MRIFDTNVQELKYKVLMEVAYQTWLGNDSFAVFNEIANEIVKKGEPPMSCCIYKDRAIVAERIRIALGGNKDNPNVIQVIDIACDECPEAGHTVTDLCRGCVAHRCADACKLGAIYFDDEQMAHIDKSKCVECGKCADVCPYGAIANFKRPCERACKFDAISMAEGGEAQIDNDKCVACGACVYQCPFGATLDTSSIVDVIRTIMGSENNTKYKVYAMVAPAIASQFTYAKLEQVVTAIKELGFYMVTEAALGADMVAYDEAQELIEKDFLTSSCCPAFVRYIKTRFPELTDHISHNLSPMATLGKFIKEHDPDAKIVFIGPCTAKKAEIKQGHVKDYIDYVLTFEELQALIDSKDIIVEELPETSLDEASYFGRIFARSGGVTAAVEEAVKELNPEGFVFNPIVCDGVDKCKPALMRASKGLMKDYNFIEGMICSGGCIGGAGCLTHGPANKKEVEEYGKESSAETIKSAIDRAEEQGL